MKDVEMALKKIANKIDRARNNRSLLLSVIGTIAHTTLGSVDIYFNQRYIEAIWTKDKKEIANLS
ncbi:hypothetical protein IC220_07420 [Wolbachia endosymbiont of Pentalonia nigronervosa]|nr:hypothetical protein [Wolbachia endosymbiont of Pentalonia nigronervosa]